jgi:hypothetical protein
MLKFLSFIFLLISFASLSQQTIKVCPGESEAVTYWVETNSLGETVWSVNGNEFYTEQLLMNWSEPGVYNISIIC